MKLTGERFIPRALKAQTALEDVMQGHVVDIEPGKDTRNMK